MMQGMEANKATICGKEQIGVRTSQMREHVECYAIHSNEERGGETRLWEELDPMSVVII
jgi:hypothetical protein